MRIQKNYKNILEPLRKKLEGIKIIKSLKSKDTDK